jgi:hypothetical protein
MSPQMKQTLALQWKAARWPLLPFVVAALGLPLAALQAANPAATQMPGGAAEAMLLTLQQWVPLFPAIATLLGITIGLTAWSWDHRANHVYALSLPITRSRYVLLKFGAGVVMLLVPALALLAGVLLGRAGLDLPEGLHAYPMALTLRFLLAALVVFALVFALAAGTMRTAIWLISGFVAFIFIGTFAVEFAREVFALPELPTPIDLLDSAFLHWPGPFHVIGGNWMPIDV